MKERQCSNCGHVAKIPEEKKTDVNISSHMLVNAFTDRFDTAFLISGDSDLVPPIEMIRQYQMRKTHYRGMPTGKEIGGFDRNCPCRLFDQRKEAANFTVAESCSETERI